jgi:hypothetical protein
MGAANGYQKYMRNHHDMETRVFFSLLAEPLFHNDARVKSVGIILLEEIVDMEEFKKEYGHLIVK